MPHAAGLQGFLPRFALVKAADTRDSTGAAEQCADNTIDTTG